MANEVNRSVDAWLESIMRTTLRLSAPNILQLYITDENSDTRKTFLEQKEALSPEFLEKVLEDFTARFLLGEGRGMLRTEYAKHQGRNEYLPEISKILSSGSVQAKAPFAHRMSPEQKPPRTKETLGDMNRGFADLWGKIRMAQSSKTSTGARIGVGPRTQVMSLKMSPYMRVGGSDFTTSPRNTLFYGVEFGTGIEENVGPGWVRRDGEFKETDTSVAPPGAWWLRNRHGTGGGMLFLGQKGFHFLYDERTRRPREEYIHHIRKELPTFLKRMIERL